MNIDNPEGAEGAPRRNGREPERRAREAASGSEVPQAPPARAPTETARRSPEPRMMLQPGRVRSPVGVFWVRYGARVARQAHNLDIAGFNSRTCNQIPMPTYRLTDRKTGAVVAPAVQADSPLSALHGQPVEAEIDVTEISPNPPAAVFTIVWPQDTARGTELVEVCTTGSRATALREMAKGPSGRSLIEETPAANRPAARGRRS